MAKYIVHNVSPYSIQLTIPAPPGGRKSAQMIIPASGALDVLPWAGSMEACRRIAFIHDLVCRGLVSVVEE